MKALGPTAFVLCLAVAGCQHKSAPQTFNPDRNAIFWQAGLDSVLDRLKPNVNEAVLNQAVTDFFDATNEKEFRRRFDKLSLPQEAKVALWDLRYGDICKAMAVAPADYVPPLDQEVQAQAPAQSFDAYYKAVSDCWNNAPDAATQIAAAKRLMYLKDALIARYRKIAAQLDAEQTDNENQLRSTKSKLTATENAFTNEIKTELAGGRQTADSLSALQSRLFLLSTQYTNLQIQYEILQRQYNLLLSQRQPSLPRALDCGPISADGSFDCIPGPH
jgi:hypothetical protein